MSRKENPYDNAAMESFWAILKKCCVFETCFKTRKAAKQAILNYIFGYYNTLRYRTAIGLDTPLNYRKRLLAKDAYD